MGLLRQPELRALAEAGATAGLAAHRDDLLADVNPVYRSRHLDATPSGAAVFVLLRDLRKLSDVARLADGSVPLVAWLEEAVFQTQSLEAGKIFRDALDKVAGVTGREPPVPSRDALPETKEKIVHRDDMLPVGFLGAGARAAESVALLQVPRILDGKPVTDAGGHRVLYSGTAWVAGPRTLLTAYHVVEARDGGEPPPSARDLQAQCAAAEAVFGFDADGQTGQPVTVKGFAAGDEALDYAVLFLADDPPAPALPLRRDALVYSPNRHIPVNILQHPGGHEKKAAIRNNLVTAVSDEELRYFTDTRTGSSGAPVLDDRWRVVGLHRAASNVDDVDFQGRKTAWVNVGTPIVAVLAHLHQYPEIIAQLAPQ